MCGRTALTAKPEDLREALGLSELPEIVPHYNVPPSQPVAVLRAAEGGRKRRLDLLRWSFVPARAKSVGNAPKLALARAETVSKTPAFRDAFRLRRCLVVVDGFFEWKRDGHRPSQPFFIRRADCAPFALASLWERWVGKDGEIVESCAIITQASRPPVDAIHDRMPLVVEHDAWDRWLDPLLTETSALALMIEPRSPALVAYSVSPTVNDPRHDEPRCIEPAEPAQLSLI